MFEYSPFAFQRPSSIVAQTFSLDESIFVHTSLASICRSTSTRLNLHETPLSELIEGTYLKIQFLYVRTM